MQRELIWYEDVCGFAAPPNLGSFVPLPSQTYEEQLNALLRLSIYYAAILAFFRRRLDPLLLPVLVASLTYLLHGSYRRDSFVKESSSEAGDRGCAKPTKHNPFMNANVIADGPDREPACDPLDPLVKTRVDEEFNRSIFRDVDDVWERNNSGRAFYTTPSTTIPNDQTGFANWLYEGMRSGGKQTRPPLNSVNAM
jgi:hypothetical protein